MSPATPPTALTVAGSDSGGGAGIQADLKTFAAHGVYGTSAITAITAQNTRGVTDIHPVPVKTIEAQINAVLSDIGADAAKTGMLATVEIIEAVAARLRAHSVERLVCDPVMVAESGDRLLEANAVDALREHLLPLAAVVAPNLHEAAILAEMKIESTDDMRRAAEEIAAMSGACVVVKGGHLEGPPIDLVLDGGDVTELTAERIDTPSTHGTGCTLSAAIAANLARGLAPVEAIRAAKAYLTEALRAAFPVGAGHGPVNHFHRWSE